MFMPWDIVLCPYLRDFVTYYLWILVSLSVNGRYPYLIGLRQILSWIICMNVLFKMYATMLMFDICCWYNSTPKWQLWRINIHKINANSRDKILGCINLPLIIQKSPQILQDCWVIVRRTNHSLTMLKIIWVLCANWLIPAEQKYALLYISVEYQLQQEALEKPESLAPGWRPS